MGRRWRSHFIVAAVALAVGVLGTWLVLRRRLSHPAAPSHEGTPGMEQGQPAGGNRIWVSPSRQQLIGVRTAVIGHRELVLSIRTAGAIAFDQTRVTEVHTRVQGWVERLFVTYEGESVRRGQPLLAVYSPELLASQADYLVGVQAGRTLSRTSGDPALASSLEEAARRRLRLRDVSEAQIAELKRTGRPSRTVTLFSPASGVLLERKTYVGQYLSPELTAFKIADLSTVWVVAQIFEPELPHVRLGQLVEVVHPHDPGAPPIQSKVTFIAPQVDPMTRRIAVRLEFPNPGRHLKPDTYVTVKIRSVVGHALAVPKQAVIDTGTRQYALLALPDGYFEPRDVKVGSPVDEYYPVLGGLEEGDRVVTSAQFLIDSETNLQAALQAMSMSMPGMKGMEAPPPKKNSEPAAPPPPVHQH